MSCFALALPGTPNEPRHVDPVRPISDVMLQFQTRVASARWFSTIANASAVRPLPLGDLRRQLAGRVEVWLPLVTGAEYPPLTIGMRELHLAAPEFQLRARFPIEQYGRSRIALETPDLRARTTSLDPEVKDLLLRATRQIVFGAARELAVDRTDGPWLRAFDLVERGECGCGFDADFRPVELPQ